MVVVRFVGATVLWFVALLSLLFGVGGTFAGEPIGGVVWLVVAAVTGLLALWLYRPFLPRKAPTVPIKRFVRRVRVSIARFLEPPLISSRFARLVGVIWLVVAGMVMIAVLDANQSVRDVTGAADGSVSLFVVAVAVGPPLAVGLALAWRCSRAAAGLGAMLGIGPGVILGLLAVSEPTDIETWSLTILLLLIGIASAVAAWGLRIPTSLISADNPTGDPMIPLRRRQREPRRASRH